VELLGKALDVTADVGYTCETAGYFFSATVEPKWHAYKSTLAKDASPSAVARHFPFTDFFSDTPAPLFPPGVGREAMIEAAAGAWRHIVGLFEELSECRVFELLRSAYDRGNFLLTKHAKVSCHYTLSPSS
jgi:intron-binding protein aquarius